MVKRRTCSRAEGINEWDQVRFPWVELVLIGNSDDSNHRQRISETPRGGKGEKINHIVSIDSWRALPTRIELLSCTLIMIAALVGSIGYQIGLPRVEQSNWIMDNSMFNKESYLKRKIF